MKIKTNHLCPPMPWRELDTLDRLAADIKRLTAEGCARVAEIYIVLQPDNQYQEGYNAACRAIAAKIREL